MEKEEFATGPLRIFKRVRPKQHTGWSYVIR